MPADFIVPPRLVSDSGERRQYRRFEVSLPAVVWRGTPGFVPGRSERDLALATRALATNMGLMGMCFRSEAMFVLGARLWVRVWLGEQVLLLPSQVRQITREKEQGRPFFICGVQFYRSPSTEEALPILAQYLLTRPEVK